MARIALAIIDAVMKVDTSRLGAAGAVGVAVVGAVVGGRVVVVLTSPAVKVPSERSEVW